MDLKITLVAYTSHASDIYEGERGGGEAEAQSRDVTMLNLT